MAEEDKVDVPELPPAPRVARLGGLVAIAASIVVGSVVILQDQITNELSSSPPHVASVESSASEPVLVNVLQSALENRIGESMSSESVALEPKIIIQFDEQHARRFNEYLLRHAEHSVLGLQQGVMPLVRVVIFNSVGI